MRYGQVAPERQRKTDLILNTLARRGYEEGYRGLEVGGGQWSIEADATDEYIVPLRRITLRADSFDALLALVATDLGFATYVHRRLGEGGRQNRQQARYALRHALRAYEGNEGAFLLACLDGDTEKRLAAFGRRDELGEAVSRAHAEARELERVMAEYDATLPTTEEEARAYLAGLPRKTIS